MSVKSNTRTEIVSTLKDRVLAISDCIIALYKEGYIPNNKKYKKLMLYNICIDIDNNISILTEEEITKFNRLIEKINIL